MKTYSATALQTYLKCPQQYVYRYVEHLWPHRPELSLLQGQLFHAMMENFSNLSCQQNFPLSQLDMPALCRAYLQKSETAQKILEYGCDPVELGQSLQELLQLEQQLESQWVALMQAKLAISELCATLRPEIASL